MMDGTAAASPFRSPVTALDGPDKVTGVARYTFDVTLPGMVHAKVLRSPHPHARIVAIDAGRAEALPGVVAVVTGADAIKLPDPYYGVAIRDQPVVGIDKVRYVGDMVAAVAALDEETAYRALALIDVRYDPLLPVTTIDEALAIKNTEIVKELALPPVKIHCSVLAEDAIRAAIGDWKKKQETAKPVAVQAAQ